MAILPRTGRAVVSEADAQGSKEARCRQRRGPLTFSRSPVERGRWVGKRMAQLARVRTPVLDLAYEHGGPGDGLPVVLLHGYPYDPRAFDEVASHPQRRRVCARSFPTCAAMAPRASCHRTRQGRDSRRHWGRTSSTSSMRCRLARPCWPGSTGEVAPPAWSRRSGRSACARLVSCAGYQIQDIARGGEPVDPEQELRFWYQHYFQTERGRKGLAERRGDIGRLLWKLWSPTWAFDEATYARTASSFDNPDFVDVVIHSYRHRMGTMPGDPRYAALEARLASLPKIAVPTIVLHGIVNDVNPPRISESHGRHFTGPFERRVLDNVGHNVPQEAPRGVCPGGPGPVQGPMTARAYAPALRAVASMWAARLSSMPRRSASAARNSCSSSRSGSTAMRAAV